MGRIFLFITTQLCKKARKDTHFFETKKQFSAKMLIFCAKTEIFMIL
jgi:hypothetical protein